MTREYYHGEEAGTGSGQETGGDDAAASSFEIPTSFEGEVSLLRLSLLDLLPFEFIDKRLGVSLAPPPLARVPTGFLALTGLAGLGFDPKAESCSVCGCSCCFFCSCKIGNSYVSYSFTIR